MNTFRWLSAVSVCLLCSVAVAGTLPTRNAQGLLASSSGQTLYTYDEDSAGKSTCNGPCAALWPPAMADAAATAQGDFNVIARADGGRQWVFQGKPLYLYVPDQKPGDRLGDGVNGTWHVVK